MADKEIAVYHDPLDALWRFAPAPYSAGICIGEMRVRVESNDPAILAILVRMFSGKPAQTEQCFLWRVIRDPEMTGEIEPAAILMDGDLRFVKMGSAVFAGVDSEQRELLAFVGIGLCDQVFQEIVVPLFAQLTLDAFPPAPRNKAAVPELALAQNNNGNE